MFIFIQSQNYLCWGTNLGFMYVGKLLDHRAHLQWYVLLIPASWEAETGGL